MITYNVIVENDGTNHWYLNGKRHRTNGPAVECADGTKAWWLNGNRHRTNGPAVECASGTKEWWLNGIQMTEADWKAAVAPKPNCDGKIVEVDGVKYRLVKVV